MYSLSRLFIVLIFLLQVPYLIHPQLVYNRDKIKRKQTKKQEEQTIAS